VGAFDPLQTGLEKTYAWIFDQMKNGGSKDPLSSTNTDKTDSI